MVILNDNLRILHNRMEDSIVVGLKGGGSIVKHSPLFSTNGKYLYTLGRESVSAYNVQTGDLVQQFVPDSNQAFVPEINKPFVHFATFEQYLLAVSSAGVLTIWNTSSPQKSKHLMMLSGDMSQSVREVHPVAGTEHDFELVVMLNDNSKGAQLFLFSAAMSWKLRNLYVRVDDRPHSVAVCDQFVACFLGERVNYVPLNKNMKKVSMLAGQGRWWTAVACVPGGGMAAGDNTGRIVFWPQPQQPKTRSIFHWHHLPVTALIFSPTGSNMYSGGGEGVMVRWNVSNPNVRNFLPRLPAPVLHLTVSADNHYVAIATLDNGIQVVDAQMRVCAVVQHLTWGVPVLSDSPLFPAGLVWDPRSRSAVLNGRPGHLQFFNTDDNKQLYNLDITGQNYVSQERHKEIINAEVSHVEVSHDGKWLVTVETRDDKEAFLETLLKFWQYKFNARQFSLSTCIQSPHSGRVHTLRLQPADKARSDLYTLVSTGEDHKFRVWTIDSTLSGWVCDSVNYYHSLPSRCVAFSSDGSILGVSFSSCLTLWDTDVWQLKASLSHDRYALKAVEFGRGECSHLVVVISDVSLDVWNLLNLYRVWSVSLHASLLCADPLTSYMAVFTADNSVFVFSPTNPKPIFEKKNMCAEDQTVLAAIFIPRPQTLLDTNTPWCAHSQLHFINSDQELQYLELESEAGLVRGLQAQASTDTVAPLSVLRAGLSGSEVRPPHSVTHRQLGSSADTAVRKLLTMPASTMPHVHLFCQKFLQALAVTRNTGVMEEPEVEIKVEVNEDSDNDLSNNIMALETLQIQAERSPRKEIKETPTKKRPRRKSFQGRRSSKQKDNSFSIDDLDSDWLSVLEKRKMASGEESTRTNTTFCDTDEECFFGRGNERELLRRTALGLSFVPKLKEEARNSDQLRGYQKEDEEMDIDGSTYSYSIDTNPLSVEDVLRREDTSDDGQTHSVICKSKTVSSKKYKKSKGKRSPKKKETSFTELGR